MNEPAASGFDTIDHIHHVEEACDRFEAALRAGSKPRIEDYLPATPDEERLAVLKRLIELEEHYRREEYRERFPEWAAAPASGPHEKYSHVAFHAQGGMGRVSTCFDRELERRVARKELRPELATNSAALGLFLQEARITGRLEHPSIVPVYELAKPADGQSPFYTMRFVSGQTLTKAVRSYHDSPTGLELLRLLNAFVVICQTVAYAHTQHVVHRDLKGDNVILGEFGEVIVLDWGLAKLLGSDAEAADSVRVVSGDMVSGHSIPGAFKGTPEFCAPEQAEGRTKEIGYHTDVYGLGAILYLILTGRPPFMGVDKREVLRQVSAREPEPPTSLVPEVPLALEVICLRALAKKPADRHSTAGDLAAEVQTWLAESAERTQAQQARERFFDLAHDLLSIIDSDKHFTRNLAWEKTLGWTREELSSFGLLDIVHPDDREATLAAVNRVLTGVGRPFFENRYRCKDGSYRWVRWTGSLITGEHLVYAVGHDITELKKTEAELRRSQERFELAVRGSGDGIWDWNRETGESYYSPRWKSMIGYEDHEISHELAEWESRLHPQDRDNALNALRSCTEGDKDSYEVEYRFRHKNGTYIWILDRGVAVRNETGVIRMAGSHSDITERKRMEEQLRKVAGRDGS